MEDRDRSVLDNPVWFSLTTKHAGLAQGSALARCYLPSVAPFAAVKNATRDAYEQLQKLARANDLVFFWTLADVPQAAGIRAALMFPLLQMVDTEPLVAVEDRDIVRLTASDATQMVDLVNRTNPGPFGIRTVETGHYIGIRDGGRLIAMAGERMCPAGFVEISAVCVDDRYRGQGLAGRLMNVLRKEIRGRGDTPFLHVRQDNTSAIALYRRLGFEQRTVFHVYQIVRDDAQA